MAFIRAAAIPAAFAVMFAASPSAAQPAGESAGIVLQVYTKRGGPSMATCAGAQCLKDWLFDVDMEAIARHHHAENLTAERRLWAVDSPLHFSEKLRRAYNKGGRVKRLEIAAHGAPGASMVLGRAALAEHFQGLDRIFLPGAEIWFHSCLIGKGPEGVAFLEELGRTLLPKGGRVLAPVSYFVLPSPQAQALLGPAVTPLQGASPAGYLRYDVAPGGAGTFTYLLPGLHEFRELLLLEKEKIAYFYRAP